MLNCSCGKQASAACSKQQCGNCCSGCSRHPRQLPPPGQPGSCDCGQVASPACDNWLCGKCCRGCSRHPYECDTYDDANDTYEESDAGPQPGQPGSCECGQIASPECDNQMCGSCCRGCSRHAYDDDGCSEESESVHYYSYTPSQPVQQQPQHLFCGCGQCASRHCATQSCRSCCYGTCTYHGTSAFEQQDSEEEEEEESDEYYGDWGASQAQQQQLRCGCGQAASAACVLQRCGRCCQAAGCTRHGRLPSAGQQQESEESESMHFHFFMEQVGNLFGSLQLSGGERASAAAAPAPPTAGGTASSTAPVGSGSGAASHAAAGSSPQAPAGGAAAAAVGAGSAAASAARVPAPSSEAEEELFQLKHCVVCLDQPRSVVLLPCKHLVLCAGCMLSMQCQVRRELESGDSTQRDVLCPVCRAPAAHMMAGVILS